MPTVSAPPLPMSDDNRAALLAMERRSSLRHRKVARFRALLLAADGVANEETTRPCQTTPDTARR